MFERRISHYQLKLKHTHTHTHTHTNTGTSKGSDEDKVPALIDFIIFEAQRIHARKIVDSESILLLDNVASDQDKNASSTRSIDTDCLNGVLRVIVEVATNDGFSSNDSGKTVERLPPLSAALLVAGDWSFPLALLRSESESVRVSALHLIGLMLDEVAESGQASFRWAWRQNQLVPPPAHYLIAVKESLRRHTATASTMEALLALLFGSSKTSDEDKDDDDENDENADDKVVEEEEDVDDDDDDDGKNDVKSNDDDNENDKVARAWKRTEWLEVILCVLSTSPNISIDLQRRVLREINMSLSLKHWERPNPSASTNINRLLDIPKWILWFRDFLRHVEARSALAHAYSPSERKESSENKNSTFFAGGDDDMSDYDSSSSTAGIITPPTGDALREHLRSAKITASNKYNRSTSYDESSDTTYDGGDTSETGSYYFDNSSDTDSVDSSSTRNSVRSHSPLSMDERQKGSSRRRMSSRRERFDSGDSGDLGLFGVYVVLVFGVFKTHSHYSNTNTNTDTKLCTRVYEKPCSTR